MLYFFWTFTSTLVRYCLHNHTNTNEQYLHLLLPSEHDRIKSTKTKTDATSQLCKRSQSAVIVSDRYIKDKKITWSGLDNSLCQDGEVTSPFDKKGLILSEYCWFDCLG